MKAVVLLSVLAVALGAPSPPPATTNQAPATDARGYLPGERVCEKILITGSRLDVRRVCATREEWSQRQLQDRQAIDNLQTRLCVYSHNSSTGHPAC